jgi:hypothetical protein
MAGADRYEVEIHLVNGHVIREDLSEDKAKELMSSRAFIWRDGMTEDDKQAAAIFTILAFRLDQGDGFLSITEADGRTWLIPTKAILTFNIKDRRDPGGLRQVGFAPLTVGVRTPSVPLPSPAIVGAKRRGA